MMMRNSFKQKNTKCTTFLYIGPDGQPVEKPKKRYATEQEAFKHACWCNAYSMSTVRKLAAYKCWTCGMWHIGRTSHVLTDEDRKKYQQKYKELK